MKTPFPKYDEALVLDIEMYLDQDNLTELVSWFPMAGAMSPYLKVTTHKGFNRSGYGRPMFEVIRGDAFGCIPQPGRKCAQCHDFAYTWDCPEHQERPYDQWPGILASTYGVADMVDPDERSEAHMGYGDEEEAPEYELWSEALNSAFTGISGAPEPQEGDPYGHISRFDA